MPYTNCAVCGAKALVGATRCPRCQAPFVSYDIGGEHVPTVNCPNCGVQRPVAIGVCPNCLMSTAPSGRRLTRGLILTGVAIAAIVTVGYLISRGTEQAKSAQIPAINQVIESKGLTKSHRDILIALPKILKPVIKKPAEAEVKKISKGKAKLTFRPFVRQEGFDISHREFIEAVQCLCPEREKTFMA